MILSVYHQKRHSDTLALKLRLHQIRLCFMALEQRFIALVQQLLRLRKVTGAGFPNRLDRTAASVAGVDYQLHYHRVQFFHIHRLTLQAVCFYKYSFS